MSFSSERWVRRKEILTLLTLHMQPGRISVRNLFMLRPVSYTHLNIPIFDNRQNKSAVQKARLQYDSSLLDLINKQKELYKNIDVYKRQGYF